MEKYIVTITETLVRDIEVEATSMSEAIDLVSDQYYEEEIVLDNTDFAGCEIEVFPHKQPIIKN